MYKVFPALILRAAMVRARTLELGSIHDYAASSSTLVAAAPSATNVYILAYGEREGLAPGERLEVYGGSVRLVRTLAYGCPRGATVESAFTGRLSQEDLDGITEQLDALHPRRTDTRKLITLQLQQEVNSPSSSHVSASTQSKSEDAKRLKRRSHEWTLRLPEINNSRVLRSCLPEDSTSLSGEQLTAQLERMRRSPEEVVVAEWISQVDESTPNNGAVQREVTGKENNGGGGAPPSSGSSTASQTDNKDDDKLNASKGGNDTSNHEEGNFNDVLLMENGVCFSSPESCGLCALRTARLAFISSIERTANGLARPQRRLSGEEVRLLEVLDVNAIDFTFAHAALQSTLELGLHTGEACRITHVPLTDAAAGRVEPQATSYVRVVAAGETGKALPRPFDFLPTRSFDVAAYTAYLPLPLGPLTKAEAKSTFADVDTAEDGPQSDSKHKRRQTSRSYLGERGISGTRLDQQKLAVQLSQAMSTLRKGACMLVTFVPTPTTVAALYGERGAQHHAEFLVERRMVAISKACIAEAISRTGRWGYITDEVLPAADSPQGSSFSLMVVLE